jgi:hypothetical protein
MMEEIGWLKLGKFFDLLFPKFLLVHINYEIQRGYCDIFMHVNNIV